MTSSEEEAHSLARHIADYVLVWAGGGGDDLAKSPHLARIGNSVYPGHCNDPTCSQFGFHGDRSAWLARSHSKSSGIRCLCSNLNAEASASA